MSNLKTQIQKRITESGGDLSNFKFRYHEESPYQKKRFKPEFVEAECWVYPKHMKHGYLITSDEFNDKEYLKIFIDTVLSEFKHN